MNIINPYRFVGAAGGYIVDDYSPEAAYSLREVASAYVGVDIITVRESGGDTTQSFTATEITDGTLTTFTGANDGFVTNLVDQTGGGNDLTTLAASRQPKIVSSGTLLTDGGKPTIKFDGDTGSGISMSTSASNSWLAGSDFSVFCVGNSDSSTRTHYLWSNNLNVTGQKRSLIGITTNRLNMVFWGSNVNLGSWTAGNQSLTSTIGTNMLTGESHNVDLWVDGSAQTGWSGTGKTTPASSIFIIGDRATAGSTNDWDGNISECIVFASDQTSNRSAIDSNITTHYGL